MDGGKSGKGGMSVGAGGAGGVDLYLLAGVKTWPSYFREPAERLKRMGIEAGYAIADVHVLYPYGDHTFPLMRQVRQVARDLVRRLSPGTLIPPHESDIPLPGTDSAPHESDDIQAPGTYNPSHESDIPASGTYNAPREAGNLTPRTDNPDNPGDATSIIVATRGAAAEPSADRIVGAIRERSAGRAVVLIGHSGGGVAAYHAARRLLAEGAVRDCRIVQIGSPKVRIHPALRDRTAYFYAADERGRVRDPITRLGTWGGIRRGAAGIPVWDSRRWAPGHIAGVAIDGGHKDYFVHGPSGAPDRPTNLERTAAAVMDWLVRSLRPAGQPSERRAAAPAEPAPPRQPSPIRQPSPAP